MFEIGCHGGYHYAEEVTTNGLAQIAAQLAIMPEDVRGVVEFGGI